MARRGPRWKGGGGGSRQPLLIAPSFLLSACKRKRWHICGAEYASFRCMATGAGGKYRLMIICVDVELVAVQSGVATYWTFLKYYNPFLLFQRDFKTELNSVIAFCVPKRCLERRATDSVLHRADYKRWVSRLLLQGYRPLARFQLEENMCSPLFTGRRYFRAFWVHTSVISSGVYLLPFSKYVRNSFAVLLSQLNGIFSILN
jgi:hypothetical protein